MRKDGLLKICFAVFLGFIVIIPSFPLKECKTHPRNNETNNSPTTTDFNITQANIRFEIQPEGNYQCSFILTIVGNEQTSYGNLNGSFRLRGKNITNFQMNLEKTVITHQESTVENSSVMSFTIHQELLPGKNYELLGYFNGKYHGNESNIYRFQLGIDWGTVVGYQEAVILLNNRFHTLVLPIEPEYYEINQPIPQKTEIKWVQPFVSSFTANLNLLIDIAHNVYLKVNMESWNASIGQTTEVKLENTGPNSIHGIILTPDWITSNVTEFTLFPYQNLSFSIVIHSSVHIGTNGTIQIISEAFLDILTINVHIVASEVSPFNLFIFSSLVSLFATFGAMGILYRQRSTINELYKENKQKFIELFSDTSVPTSNQAPTTKAEVFWREARSRWESILPENELNVLEILCKHGSMNQQSIANKLGVSKMTMSRIISRLETKRLLFRERLGFSKIIKLNKKQLGYEDSN